MEYSSCCFSLAPGTRCISTKRQASRFYNIVFIHSNRCSLKTRLLFCYWNHLSISNVWSLGMDSFLIEVTLPHLNIPFIYSSCVHFPIRHQNIGCVPFSLWWVEGLFVDYPRSRNDRFDFLIHNPVWTCHGFFNLKPIWKRSNGIWREHNDVLALVICLCSQNTSLVYCILRFKALITSIMAP